MSEDKFHDLECTICFSDYNNGFRVPKVLECGHVFCLECLARMNMKSHVAEAILCPMCRGISQVPLAGLPKLNNDPAILSALPNDMKRIYSVRFNRTKGRLLMHKPRSQIKKKVFVNSVSQTLDVSNPSQPVIYSLRKRICWPLSKAKYCLATFVIIVVTLALFFVSIWAFNLPQNNSSSWKTTNSNK
ncbi:RING finger protein 223-like [Callorhinchus milii]|uniref:RING finger protein 223-like n=1 Tax=Callorhinchus milii TaxID=7868 RepID=UPI00045715A0|nr:RING finger protein 223-like [Callorhinchus milii]XP_042193717.1 RING finger protein 223-like [Callorhinchus milii]|eukprot:gi/632964763/ref/XP_007898555.1/ PREDICTED: RING finger protein 223-like [Callorhinchus milii]